jgi:2-keto-4-pentenoate hydratase/2-oxohepta-3-ene-1,7-dioic acid hydratase in catechol pathway
MRYAHLGGPEPALAAQLADRFVRLGGELDGIETLEHLIDAGPDAWAAAEELAPRLPAVSEPRLAAPLLKPSKIACVGLNYHDHATEQGVLLPDVPLIFAKFPSAIVGPDDAITWQESVTREVDFEVELAVVVGKRLDDVSPDDALAGVFGYTIANDVSARDLQRADGQFTRAKSLNTFLPLGPIVVTADELGEPGGRRVATRVNGTLMQDSNTDQLIFGVGEVLSFLSRHATLVPGDLVLTGTPAGVGAFRTPPTYLAPGDVVEVEVEGIGVLRNPVAAPVALVP